ncbi:MAG: peptidoglycan DD-metalloendopeptidase family protein [Clostridia bacterium]|nr:peptidoglycan DD-metalloendopeptidase family protein [Clostridia bacterium]
MAGNLFKRLISTLISLILVMSGVYCAMAEDDIDGMISEKEQIEARFEQAREDLAKNEESVSLKEEYKAALEEKLAMLSGEASEISDDIALIENEISQKNTELATAERKIADRMEIFRGRLKDIYMSERSTAFWEILLGSESLSDCVDMMVLLNGVSKKDQQMIDDIQAEMDIIISMKQELSSKKDELSRKSGELNSKRAEVNELVEENQEVLEVLYVEAEKARDQLDQNNEQLIALENDIAAYYAEQKRLAEEKAEQERLEEERKRLEEEQKLQDQLDELSTDSDQTDEDIDELLPENPDSEQIGAGGYVWPVPGFYWLSSEWNEDRTTYNHGAIDIAGAGIYGASVVAAAAGTVIYSYSGCPHDYGKEYSCGCGGGYGNYVMIDHGDGRSTLYAHLSSLVVGQGEYVFAGQVLGSVGSTGHSTGPHLHFETRLYGEKYNPMLEY